jgi:hypothetical protein
MQYNVPATSIVATDNETSLDKPPFMKIFGPLDKEYCMWFYFLSLIGFVLMIIIFITGLFIGIYRRKGFEYYYYLLMASFVYGIFYFQNRLFYNMCSKTL